MKNVLISLFTNTLIMIFISDATAEKYLINYCANFTSLSISQEDNVSAGRQFNLYEFTQTIDQEEITILCEIVSAVIDTTTELDLTICVGESVIVNGTIYNENNPSSIEVFSDINGCDSIILVNLSFVEPSFTVNGLDMIANLSDADNYQWLLDGNPISEAINNSWTALENGNYALQIEINGVSCTSDAITIVTNTVYEISQDPIMKIYPNPIQDYIFIELSNALVGKIIRYEIINLAGQVIQKGIYQNKINIESFESGIFLLRLFDKEQNIYLQKIKS